MLIWSSPILGIAKARVTKIGELVLTKNFRYRKFFSGRWQYYGPRPASCLLVFESVNEYIPVTSKTEDMAGLINL